MIDFFYQQPPTADNLQKAIRALGENYPRLKIFPIGKSTLGREITALCIGNPTGAISFVGATHGLEWLTCTLLIKFCHNLLDALETGQALSEIDVNRALRNRSLVIIPCLNPDGVEIALRGSGAGGRFSEMIERTSCGVPEKVWQANAAGVDINHNFDAGWTLLKAMEIADGFVCPGPTRYGGPHPHSEPETMAATTFCMTYQPKSLYCLHSQGEEIYWHYGNHTPKRSKMMAQILASSSGYALSKPEGLASHGGFKDWFIDKFHRPGFTIEVGLGKNPLPLSDLDKIYTKIEEMLMIATLL
ncbi:MAG: M14 family metallocarboxypeptidase [Oscillospiraceae bacterium]|nr:M14 family metallocarboxypeptidase [Oscillospiraceae bacterium]